MQAAFTVISSHDVTGKILSMSLGHGPIAMYFSYRPTRVCQLEGLVRDAFSAIQSSCLRLAEAAGPRPVVTVHRVTAGKVTAAAADWEALRNRTAGRCLAPGLGETAWRPSRPGFSKCRY